MSIKEKPERWISLAVILCSVALVGVLAAVLGKWQVDPRSRHFKVRFEAVAGISLNTPVRFAGAPAGRVTSVRILPRAEQAGPGAEFYYVELTLAVPRAVEVGADVKVQIKQDGVLGSKFVGLIPGSPQAPLLPEGAILWGEESVDLLDLAGPGKKLLSDMEPLAKNLTAISTQINESLPQVLERMDRMLANGDDLLKEAGSPANRARLEALLRNLKVVSENLKVLTTHAKALTATLGERPWRMIWGGEPNVLPTEKEILDSDTALPAPARSEPKNMPVK